MVISADGNTYLGKTTYLRSLMDHNRECCILVEEYDTDLAMLECLPTHHDRQVYYFSLEADRVKRYGGITEKTLLLDRSYLSILAHSWAMSRLENCLFFSDTLGIFYKQLENGLVMIPDRYLFFIQEDESLAYSDYFEKGSEEILYDMEYRRQINAFFSFLKSWLMDGMCPIQKMLIAIEQLKAELEHISD